MKILGFCLASSIVANVFLLGMVIDRSITIHYSLSSISYLQDTANLTLHILNHDWVGRNADDVKNLRTLLEKEGHIIDRTDNEIGIGELIFNLSDNKVSSVKYLNP